MEEQLNLFAPDTLASLSPTPGSEKARKMTATSGRKCLGLCGSLGPLGSLEKMLLDTSRWASTLYFLTWKVKPTKQGYLYYQLQPSKPRTEETGYSSWATPNTMDSLPQRSPEALIKQATTTRKGRSKPANLREQVDPQTMKLWPTPATQDAKNSTLPRSQINRDSVPGAIMREGHEGQLNPDWVEALMGFPIGWTDLEVDESGDHWIDNPRWPAFMGQVQHSWEPPRTATCIKNRTARLKALGNAVVPLQSYPILYGIRIIQEYLQKESQT